MTAQAIEHALAAEDYPHVVLLIEKVALPLILQAYVRTVEGWLQAIPPAFLVHSHRANMAYAWLHILRGAFAQAAPYLERLEAIFSSPETGSQDPSLQGEWFAIQSKLLSVQGKTAESIELANRALHLLSDADVHVRSMVLVNLATAYQQMLDYAHAAEIFEMIIRDARAMGDHVSETLAISGQAQMLLQQGRLHLAFDFATEGIKRLEASGKNTPFSATLFGELGQIHYHWHHLDQAQQYLQLSIQTSGQSGYSDPEIYHHVMRSRMFQMEENWNAAAGEMHQAGELARLIPPAMIREEVIAQQVRVHLAFDRLAAAQDLLKPEGFSFEDGFHYPELPPGANVTHTLGLLYNSALHILLHQARGENNPPDLKHAIGLATGVLAGELQCQHMPIALETLLLRSQLYAALGDEQASLADVASALELAEPEGFISLFVEAGPPIAEALETLLARNMLGAVQPGYVKDILAVFPGAQPPEAAPGRQPALTPQANRIVGEWDESKALVEPLTNREMEVLQLIAAGDSNRTIAEKLVITVSAVKKHTGNVFGKLNVSSRTQAVARARQLGLLSPDG